MVKPLIHREAAAPLSKVGQRSRGRFRKCEEHLSPRMDGAEPNSQMGKDTHLCKVAHRVSVKALEAMTGEAERGAERVKPKT